MQLPKVLSQALAETTYPCDGDDCQDISIHDDHATIASRFAAEVVRKALEKLGHTSKASRTLATNMSGNPRVRFEKALRRLEQ